MYFTESVKKNKANDSVLSNKIYNDVELIKMSM